MPPLRAFALLVVPALVLAVACGGGAEPDPERDAALIAASATTRFSEANSVLAVDVASTTYNEALQMMEDQGFQNVNIVTINGQIVAPEPESDAPVWFVTLAGSDPEPTCAAYGAVVLQQGLTFVWSRREIECPEPSDVAARDTALLAAGTRFLLPPAVQAVQVEDMELADALAQVSSLGLEPQEVTTITRGGGATVWLVTFVSTSPDIPAGEPSPLEPTPPQLELPPCEDIAKIVDDDASVVLFEATRPLEVCP